MKTQYDQVKKTTFDMVFPKNYKDKINVQEYIRLTNIYFKNVITKSTMNDSIFYTNHKEELKSLFKDLSIEDLYKLKYLLSIANPIMDYGNYIIPEGGSNPMLVSMYIKEHIRGNLYSNEITEVISEEIKEELENNISAMNSTLLTSNHIDEKEMCDIQYTGYYNILYLNDLFYYRYLVGDEDLLKDLLLKFNSYMINHYEKLLGNNPTDPYISILPYYINYNYLLSSKINKELKETV